MKRSRLGKSAIVMCLMLMLAWTTAGCGNTAGFAAPEGDPNDASAVIETPEQEQPQEQSEEAKTPDEPAEPAESADVTAEAEEISITDIGAVSIGQTENSEAGTGCTVFISKDGMPAGLDVRGGGPASRESELLDPLAAASGIHAIVLSGGGVLLGSVLLMV